MSSSKQDIITAIKNSDIFLKIPELKGAKPKLNSNGSPFVYVGGFNMVFQLEHQKKNWAFRVWHVPMGKQIDRYRKISKYLSENNLSYFADFIYDERGILVNGIFLDTIRMEWLEGKLLKTYIEENLTNKLKLTNLASNFLEMCKSLRENQISHGDLQEGNILIDRNDRIKLVDYDSVCIPQIEGEKELITGLKGYQHPSRFKNGKTSLKSDYFSELVIYLSILAFAEKPNLWKKLKVNETQYLLFDETDFENFELSDIYNELTKMSNLIKSLTRILLGYLKESDFRKLNSFDKYLNPPAIKNFKSNKYEILEGNSVELTWEIINEDNIYINDLKIEGTTFFSEKLHPNSSSKFKLKAENAFGNVENEVSINVLPFPKITQFNSKQQKLEFGKTTQLIWKIQNGQKAEVHFDGQKLDISLNGVIDISPQKDTLYILIVTALDGEAIFTKETNVRVYHKIQYTSFTTNFHQIPRGVEIELSWKVEHAENLVLRSNDGLNEKVSSSEVYKLFPTKSNSYWLEGRNDLFNTKSNSLRIEVDNAPQMTRIPSFFEENQIPLIDLKIPELQSIILDETQLEFEKMIQPKRSFSISKMLNSILRK
jgi:serine/threonine protein kinase